MCLRNVANDLLSVLSSEMISLVFFLEYGGKNPSEMSIKTYLLLYPEDRGVCSSETSVIIHPVF
jgi:hypothetical protein